MGFRERKGRTGILEPASPINREGKTTTARQDLRTVEVERGNILEKNN